MPHSKAARSGPTAKADSRRSAGVSGRHHILMVTTPPAGCLVICSLVSRATLIHRDLSKEIFKVGNPHNSIMTQLSMLRLTLFFALPFPKMVEVSLEYPIWIFDLWKCSKQNLLKLHSHRNSFYFPLDGSVQCDLANLSCLLHVRVVISVRVLTICP